MTNQILSFDKNSTQMLRGIGILAVLLGHLKCITWGGAGGVVLFLIISGYGLHESYKKNGMRGFWRKRILAVYIPYLLAAIINVLAYSTGSKKEILFTLLGLDFNVNIDPTMWYISYIFFWYLAYYIIFSLPVLKSSYGMIAKAFLMYIAATYVHGKLQLLGTFHSNAISEVYLFAFPLGVLFSAFAECSILKPLDKHWKAIWVIVYIISFGYLLRAYQHSATPLFAITMAIAPISVIKLAKFPSQVQRPLLWFGKYSFPLYLVEGILLYRREYWFDYLTASPWAEILFMLVTCVSGYIFSKSICEPVTSAVHHFFFPKHTAKQ